MTCLGHTRPCFISSTIHFISDALRRSACPTATGKKSADDDQGDGNEKVFHSILHHSTEVLPCFNLVEALIIYPSSAPADLRLPGR
jgi:hypothetical protein